MTTEEFPLPMNLLLAAFKQDVEFASLVDNEQEMEETGKELREKAERYLSKLTAEIGENPENYLANAMLKAPPALFATIQEGATFWGERVIPNVLVAQVMKREALKRVPQLEPLPKDAA